MTQTLLETTRTGLAGGQYQGWGGSTNLKNGLDAQDSTGARIICNIGSSYSSAWDMDDFVAAVYPNITSVQVRSYQKRSGTTDNAKDRYEIDRNGSGDWWLGALKNDTGGWTTQTVTAPSGGWNTTKLNALRHRWYHEGGSQTSSKYIQHDYFRVWVNWEWYIPHTISPSHSAVSESGCLLDGSFNANGDGACEYRFQVKPDGGSYDSPSWEADVGNTGVVTCNQRAVSGLASGTLHQYRLVARNEGDVGYTSSEGSFTTNAGSAGLIIFY